MLFYEPLFITIFPAFYAVYLLAGGISGRKWLLLVASALFYFWGEPAFVLILLASTAIDYALSFHLTEPVPTRRRRLVLGAGVALNLGILVVYKYADFLADNLNAVLSPFGAQRLPLLHLALPIGVSFVVFEKITYLVDTYRGISKRAATFRDYCLFVLFFPKLLAGPILKYHEMQDQIAKPRPVEWDDFGNGFLRFSRGIGRKLLIADPLGSFVNTAFAADPASLSANHAWLALGSFTLQIYFDFAGYSDMAIGLARMLGFGLRENFNAPYASRSITEFWRRWHISLTTWIRDYLYKPLGGNRESNARTYLNLWICFLLSGLWHGASWNFVLWGAYNGLFLTLDRLFLRDALNRCGAVIATFVTLLIVMIGWAIFRSESPAHLTSFISALFGMSHATDALEIPAELPFTLALGAVISLLPATPLYPALVRRYQASRSLRAITIGLLIVIYVLAIARAVTAPFQPFIYFRF
ncbi:MAG TPA: MBOAT family O-acyltransferase [Bradyrhizobium sp.]|uniref:MBOAT family O-acyltransferase n=1 Tax=Bradyrhizobium sp. TaxID=376 RepID=UPI002D7E17CF|nr:MBOAT family O-acyltransferase [Bradyrhizobium sp.]HET7887806.1 MBOAT family O-acyltransferase [Bradyrhizobium sp.]